MKYALAVDPGKTSGIAMLSWSQVETELPILEASYEVDEESFAQIINTHLEDWFKKDIFFVVCERFTITAQTVRNSQAPYSLEQIGVLKHLCRVAEYSVNNISFQTPVDAKNMFPNEALKKIGTWHKGGEGHANDAIRHALLKMTKSGWKPRILLES